MTRNAHPARSIRGSIFKATALALTLSPSAVLAQTEAPAPAPAAEVAPVEAPAPAPAPAPEAAPAPPAPVVAQAETGTQAPGATPSATLAETSPPPASETDKPLSVAVWGRIGNKAQNARDTEKLNDLSQDAEVNLLLSGSVHKYVKWQSNFVATYGGGKDKITGDASILDLIGQLEFHDSFNVWFGRMLVPSDRSNFSGPWFMSPWNYPGFYPTLTGGPVGPRQGPFGRNDGATIWGQFAGGVVKYYAGVFDLHANDETPLFTSRLNISLINPEPGYYSSSTYYGGKDILAIGVSGQYKKDGSVQLVPKTGDPMMTMEGDKANYTGFSADVLFEKKLGDAGVIDLEGAFYVFDGDYEFFDNHFYALASYLTPGNVGIGKLQPLVRFQGASPAEGDMWQTIDAQVGYVMNDYAARLALGYQYSKIDAGPDSVKGNAIFLGLQLQK